jgi:trigger factor
MQVSVQMGEGLKRELRVDLPADDFEAEIDKRLRSFARSARLPGFRPGKVPVRFLRQQYGEKVRSEVFSEMVQSTFASALKQENLAPAGMPTIEPDIDPKARRYAYKASFEVLPTVVLKPFAGTQIKRPVAEVTEADVEQMFERLRQQRLQWVDVERVAQQGDRVTVSFTGRIDGENFEGGTAENFPIELGSGRMIPGFEEQLSGARAGDEPSLRLRFPDDYHGQHVAGKEAHFDVSVHAVAEPHLPEIDAEFIRAMGVDSGDMAEFRADVRETMEVELHQRVADALKTQVMDALMANHPLELPQSMVEQEALRLRESFAKSMGNQRLTLSDAFYRDTARRRLHIGLMISEVVKLHGLEVEEEAVKRKLRELTANAERPQEALEEIVNDQARLSQIHANLLEELAVARLLEEAEVVDEPKGFFELTDRVA